MVGASVSAGHPPNTVAVELVGVVVGLIGKCGFVERDEDAVATIRILRRQSRVEVLLLGRILDAKLCEDVLPAAPLVQRKVERPPWVASGRRRGGGQFDELPLRGIRPDERPVAEALLPPLAKPVCETAIPTKSAAKRPLDSLVSALSLKTTGLITLR